jgi:hypothetical protein
MLNKITAKGPLNFQSDLGQYNVISKKLQLWFIPSRIGNTDEYAIIQEFDFPNDVEKLEVIDPASDLRMKVPVDVFKSTLVPGEGYKFPYKEWRRLYTSL